MGAAPLVTVVLPKMLAEMLGEGRLQVRGATIAEALEEAYRRLPALRHHLCDETGELRTHVLCLHNGASTRDARYLRREVREGDEIRVVQAISGG
jgi:molybdopterin synthase sulfur carrier subunit